jgi:hypothetical protein
MFNPELYCLIQRVNDEIEPLISQERLQVMFDLLIVILSVTIITLFGYEITVSMGKIFWSLLTPGQQLLEILMIIGGIGMLVLIKLTIDDLTKVLVKNFNCLKEQNAEKVKRITELERDNESLKEKVKYLNELVLRLEESYEN